jgi:hypothetical protein
MANWGALACFLLSLSLVFSGCLSFGDDDWSLEVKFDGNGDVVGSKRLG